MPWERGSREDHGKAALGIRNLRDGLIDHPVRAGNKGLLHQPYSWVVKNPHIEIFVRCNNVDRVHCTTSTPMLRAVPSTHLMAASSVKQFRSGILILAISSTCLRVILPTFVLCGSADPFARFTARLINTGAGGVLVMKVNVRSE